MELGPGQGAETSDTAGASTCRAGDAAPTSAPPPTPHPPPTPEQLEPVLRRLVGRKVGMFARFPDVTEDDLLQECRLAVARGWHRFDPTRSTWVTFAYLVASRNVLDLHRKRTRLARHDAILATLHDVTEWAEAGDTAGLAGGLGDRGDETAAEWLAGVYRQAVRRFPGRRRGKRGRAWFSPAQVVAVALLMRKKSLSVRGARELLLADPDLRRVLRLRHVPHPAWFGRAAKFATDNLRLPRGGWPADRRPF